MPSDSEIQSASKKAILKILLSCKDGMQDFNVRNRAITEITYKGFRYGLKKSQMMRELVNKGNVKTFNVAFNFALLDLIEQKIVSKTNINNLEHLILTSRLNGTVKSRLNNLIENTALAIFDESQSGYTELLDLMHFSRWAVCVWTTSDGTLRVDGTEGGSAMFVPVDINIGKNGISITEGFLVLVSMTGHIRICSIGEMGGAKASSPNKPKYITDIPHLRMSKTARKKLFHFEKTTENPRGWILTVNPKFLPVLHHSNHQAPFRIFPKTSLMLRPSISACISLTNVRGILQDMGGDISHVDLLTKRLKGPAKIIAPHVINRVFGLLLPKDASSVMRRLPSCNINQWNTVNHPEAEIALRRRQFLLSHKGLWFVFSSGNDLKEILELVDAGNSVMPLISHKTGIPVSVVRHLVSVPWQMIIPGHAVRHCAGDVAWQNSFMLSVWKNMLNFNNDYEEDEDAVIFMARESKTAELFRGVLAVMPPEWLPKNNLHWYIFIRLLNFVLVLNSNDLSVQSAMRVIRRHGGCWNAVGLTTVKYEMI